MNQHLMSVCVAILFISVQQSAIAERKSSGVPRFDAAVVRGVEFLKGKVDVDKTEAGPLVLSAYALFKCGEPVDSPVVKAGLKAVLESIQPDGYRPHVAYDHLYEAGLFSMFLADVNSEKYQPQIQRMADYVASKQRADGSWADTPTAAADVSMCQYAVLSLWAAQRTGCTIPAEVLDKTVNWHLSHRNADGGWTYRPGTGTGTTGANSSRNMTMAAISSLGVTRLLYFGQQMRVQKPQESLRFGVLQEVDNEPVSPDKAFPDYNPQHSAETITAGIERGLGFESANFNPVNINANFPIYFYYSAERALSVSETDKVAGRDWFTTYGDGLLSLQNEAGGWNETYSGEVVGTSFALLYFMRSTKQLIDKEYGPGQLITGAGNPFGDRAETRRLTELSVLLHDIAICTFLEGDTMPPDFPDEIVRSVTSIDDPKNLVGQEELLRSLLCHPDADVRRAACWALGRTGDFKLIPLMLDRLRDPSVDVNVEAIAALRFIARKPDGFGETLHPLKGLELAPKEIRLRAANDWRQKAIVTWSNWYFRVRPHEEQGRFDQLLVAVPFNGPTADGKTGQ